MSNEINPVASPTGDECFENKINLHQVQTVISDLEGKILTVIDASITDQKQREAIKSLLRQYIWGDFDKVRDWFYNQDSEKGIGSNFPFRGNVTGPEN
jgi:hypothetical protein